MATPVILMVNTVTQTEREIRARYGSEYEILRVEYASTARTLLNALRSDNKEIALVLAALNLPDSTGEELLCWTRDLHSNIKRGLIVSWNNEDARVRLLKAMSMGEIDSWTYEPTAERDEQFHRAISELLEEWDRWNGIDVSEIALVGKRLSRECQEVRDLLLRAGYPHRTCDIATPEGRHILTLCGATEDDVPIVLFPNGKTLVKPTRGQLAEAFGVHTHPSSTDYDVAIIGAGPAGLSAATYAASEGLKTVLFEQESVGGQAGSSALIRNYLGFPRGVSGPELASRAYQQAWLFGTDLLYGTAVTTLKRTGDRLLIARGEGEDITARAVIIATGVQYSQIGIPSIESFVGAGVFYGSSVAAAPALGGESVFIVGGGNSAGQAALHLSKHQANVSMLVRSSSFAESMSAYLIREIDRAPNIEVFFETDLVDAHGTGRLESITLRNQRSGQQMTRNASAVFIFIGAAPHTEWLPEEIQRDRWGFIETGRELSAEQAALSLETSMAGVFAVGDVRRGSMKRVASAVGEGSICVPQVHEYLDRL